MHYKIAYLTSKNPLDKGESSGVYYYQSLALKKQNIELCYLGPANNLVIAFIRTVFNFLRKFMIKKYNTQHCIIISKIYGRIFSKKLQNGNYDLVFADKASCEIAYLNTDIPVLYSTDATFNLIHNYYPEFSNLLKVSEKEGNIIEQRTLSISSMVLCVSSWAASSVINDYNYPSTKIHVIPRGANIDSTPDRAIIIRKNKTGICRLLFIGRDIYRKGYDVAYNTMVYLRSKGVPVKLTVAGCSPPAKYVDEDVEIIPHIDKNTKSGVEQFDKIMFNSDFFLLPTRAEAMGIAFCEAAAYGLPVITRDTGGVTEVVKNGINGYALNYEADHREFGEKIMEIFGSDEKYHNLIRSSRDYYEQRLNWDVWGIRIKNILDDYFASRSTQESVLSQAGLIETPPQQIIAPGNKEEADKLAKQRNVS